MIHITLRFAGRFTVAPVFFQGPRRWPGPVASKLFSSPAVFPFLPRRESSSFLVWNAATFNGYSLERMLAKVEAGRDASEGAAPA
jgi:hypothetical protein